MSNDAFPKYLLKVGGQRKFLSFSEAVAVFSNGFQSVSFGWYVLSEDFSVMPMTEEDKDHIAITATESDENK